MPSCEARLKPGWHVAHQGRQKHLLPNKQGTEVALSESRNQAEETAALLKPEG